MPKAKSFQFVRNFLTHEFDIDPRIACSLLESEIEFSDKVNLTKNTISVKRPTSSSHFLFNVLYNLIKPHIQNEYQRDKLALGLLYQCKDYVYTDTRSDEKKLSVVVDFIKLTIPSTIVREIIEPLTGKTITPKVLFANCPMVDVCEIIESSDQLIRKYQIPHQSISVHDYPLCLINTGIHNKAAQTSHLIYKILVLSFGEKKAEHVIKHILSVEDRSIFDCLMIVLKILSGDAIFIMDFLKFFRSNCTLSNTDTMHSDEIILSSLRSDNYLRQNIKTAGDGKHTPEVNKQWHQWAFLVGLIEKQLDPMRGSMWPASENIKPFEDAHRQLEIKKTQEKGDHLNFEELLALSREWYDHKAVQPGQLIEHLLKEERVWK
jgi:hypothetical protein